MAKTSAGLLMFRLRNGEPEVLLVHPGGPFWAKKVVHAWAVEGDCDPAQLHSNLFLWNGRRSRASNSNSLRLTEPSGSLSEWRSRRSFPRNAGSSPSW